MSKQLLVNTGRVGLLFGAAGVLLWAANTVMPVQLPANITPPTVSTTSGSVVLTGDLMLGRYLPATIDKHGFDWVLPQATQELLRSADVTVVNHEGVMRSSVDKVPSGDDTAFAFPPRYAPLLADAGVDLVSLANNHSQDFGRVGVRATKASLAAVGINSFGSFYNASDLAVIQRVGDLQVAFVGYNDISPLPANERNFEAVLEQIDALRTQVDRVISVVHFGTEFSQTVSQRQRQLAHALIDAGSDVVIGHHPHVLQSVEIYRNRAIFYSLGNFIFDQIKQQKTRRGLITKIDFERTKTSFTLFPTEIDPDTFRVDLLNGDAREQVLAALGVASGELVLQEQS